MVFNNESPNGQSQCCSNIMKSYQLWWGVGYIEYQCEFLDSSRLQCWGSQTILIEVVFRRMQGSLHFSIVLPNANKMPTWRGWRYWAMYRQSHGIFTFQEKPNFVALRVGKLIIDERSVSLVIGRKGDSYVYMADTDRSREVLCAIKRSFFRDLTSSLREFNSFIVE